MDVVCTMISQDAVSFIVAAICFHGDDDAPGFELGLVVTSLIFWYAQAHEGTEHAAGGGAHRGSSDNGGKNARGDDGPESGDQTGGRRAYQAAQHAAGEHARGSTLAGRGARYVGHRVSRLTTAHRVAKIFIAEARVT